VSLSLHEQPAPLLTSRRAVSSQSRAAERAELRARAYCGDAHHQVWTGDGEHLPEQVDLPAGAGKQRYHLVRDPLTGRPAHAPDGALVFVPACTRD
jgi:hypothetical protein